MKSALVIRHVQFEDLGTLESLLREKEYEIRYCDAAVEDLSNLDPLRPDLLVVLGGPIGAFDERTYPFLADELALIQQRLDNLLPILGICLGAQLMARALGARVYSMGVKEIGFSPLTFTEEGQQSPLAALGDTPVLHWHGDQFDIPSGAIRLAGTPICPNQAFAVEDYALGLQFHLEADTTQIERWLIGHANELAQSNIDPRSLRLQAHAAQTNPLAEAARKVINGWIDVFYIL